MTETLSSSHLICEDGTKKAYERTFREGINRIELLASKLAGHPFVESLIENESTQALVKKMPHEEFLNLFRLLRSHVPRSPRKRAVEINSLDAVVDAIRKANKILVITGAGISTSCGIPDFRSSDGVYSMLGGYSLSDPQDLFSISYFKRNTRPFFDFARKLWPGTHKPAPTHYFIKRLEEAGKLHRSYTQNIDTLETVAGIKRVLQCHGSFATATCSRCSYQCPGSTIQDDIFNQRMPMCPKCTEKPPPSLMLEYAMTDPSISDFPNAQPIARRLSVFSLNESDNEGDLGTNLASGNGQTAKEDLTCSNAPNGHALNGFSNINSSLTANQASPWSANQNGICKPRRSRNNSLCSETSCSSPRVSRHDSFTSTLSVMSASTTAPFPLQPTKASTVDPFKRVDSEVSHLLVEGLDDRNGAMKTSELPKKSSALESRPLESTIPCANIGQAEAIEHSSSRDGLAKTDFDNSTAPPPRVEDLPFVDEFYDKGILRPDIIFFGEKLPDKFFDAFEEDMGLCDLILVMGTSLKVAPVSHIPEMVNPNCPQVLINRERVAWPHQFDAELLGNCDNVVTAMAEKLQWTLGDETVDVQNKINKTWRRCNTHKHRFLFEGCIEEEYSPDCPREELYESDCENDENEFDNAGINSPGTPLVGDPEPHFKRSRFN